METLNSRLKYSPQPLRFGTSGRRGEVVHLSQLEIYINASAELAYLQTLSADQGGIRRGDPFYLAYDLRPSSTGFVGDQGGRGEIAQTIDRAIRDAGMEVVNLGALPTPALTYYGISRGRGSMMVTGSHIPFDRNGYKTNTSRGELLKEHEGPVNETVEQVRLKLYEQPFAESLFDEGGFLKERAELPEEDDGARAAYLARYVDFFEGAPLAGMRLLFYQHSSVGRDLVPDILEALGAEVIRAGRSDVFVPIDTENIEAAQLGAIQALANEAMARHGVLDAVVSTDGDSDRPLVLGVDASTGQVRFFGGDLVGMVVAEYLGADAVVVPISCNDAIDRGALAPVLEPKTRIGSPFVIAGMQKALARGRKAICGWEANGGFLTGSAIERDGRTLRELPTRDAVLPIVGALCGARAKGVSLIERFGQLPKRFSRAALLKQFPRPIGLKIVATFSPSVATIQEVDFAGRGSLTDESGAAVQSKEALDEFLGIRWQLAGFFTGELGFPEIARLNYTDGVRVIFENGDVAHLRPSGNADELRIYAVADEQERADEIAAAAVREPDGILRAMEKFVTGG